MEKSMLGLLAFSSATASAFGISPLQPDEPIANIFGLIVGMFGCAVVLVVSGYFPRLRPRTTSTKEEFGGGGASGKW